MAPISWGVLGLYFGGFRGFGASKRGWGRENFCFAIPKPNEMIYLSKASINQIKSIKWFFSGTRLHLLQHNVNNQQKLI